MTTIAMYDDIDNKCFHLYQANIAPKEGEMIHLPHQGLFRVEKVVHRVSDDGTEIKSNGLRHMYDELMFIDVIVSKE